MPAKLYVVHGSHPSAAVEKALQLKGIAYTTVEIPPPLHLPICKLLFGRRTVPAIRFEGGEKLSGSRQILARIEELVPEPALLPADAAAAAVVLEAERWGEEVLQPLARRAIWPTLKAHPEHAPSFAEGGKLKLPAPVLRLSMRGISRAEIAINHATPAAWAADFAALPSHLNRIDAWLADGTLGAEPVPNRGDLQIGSSLALLMTFADLRAIIAPRPAGQLADRLFHANGYLPAGSIPAALLPAASTAAPA